MKGLLLVGCERWIEGIGLALLAGRGRLGRGVKARVMEDGGRRWDEGEPAVG